MDVDGITFNFNDTWTVTKYDDWSYYRRFRTQRPGIKGIDIIAISPESTAYLIEVKDYRHPDTQKPSQVPEAIADKVIFTLAAMLPARLRANLPEERDVSEKVLSCVDLHVVFHMEQPRRHKRRLDPADVRMKLKQRLKAIDSHVKVVHSQNMRDLPWTVTP